MIRFLVRVFVTHGSFSCSMPTALCPPFRTNATCALLYTHTHHTFFPFWPCYCSSQTWREASDRWAGLLDVPFLQLIVSHPLSGVQCSTEINQCLLETVLSVENTNWNKRLLRLLVVHSLVGEAIIWVNNWEGMWSVKDLKDYVTSLESQSPWLRQDDQMTGWSCSSQGF